jgi:3-oxoadipate enol-lactonase
MATTNYYTHDSATLTYQDEGEGPPVLLVHAFPLGGAMWEPQIGALAGANRLIAPDLRGFGSSSLGTTPTSLDQYADDLAGLLDELDLRQVTLGGLSMGGYIAFAFLRRHPERVAALILADTRPGADSEEGRQGREKNARLAEAEGASAVGEAMLPKLVAQAASDELRERIRRIVAMNSSAGVAAALRCMAARPDSTSILQSIDVPTLIIVGSEDTLTVPDESRAMHAAIRDSRLVEIPGAGHLTNLEAPEAFNQALASFLSSMPR